MRHPGIDPYFHELVGVHFVVYLLIALIGLFTLRPTKFFSLFIGWMLYESVWIPVLIPIIVAYGGISDSVVGLIAIAIAPIIVVWCHVSALVGCRFLLRLGPIDPLFLDISKRAFHHRIILFLLAVSFIFYFLIGARAIILGQGARILVIGLSSLLLAGHSALLIWYRISKPLSPSAFILFLRSFNTFSDRSLLFSLLKFAPKGIPVALVLSHEDDADTWDPLMIGLSGLRWWRGLGSMPLYFSLPHDDWKYSVKAKIMSATAIVIDISKRSDSMQYELDCVNSCQKMDKTIIVTDTTRPSAPVVNENLVPSLRKEMHSYLRTWLRFLYITAPWIVFIVSMSIFVIFLFSITRDGTGLLLMAFLVTLIFMIVFSVYYFVNIRQVIDKNTERKIRIFLAETCSSHNEPGKLAGSTAK